jgi:hypothetical protein
MDGDEMYRVSPDDGARGNNLHRVEVAEEPTGEPLDYSK